MLDIFHLIKKKTYFKTTILALCHSTLQCSPLFRVHLKRKKRINVMNVSLCSKTKCETLPCQSFEGTDAIS